MYILCSFCSLSKDFALMHGNCMRAECEHYIIIFDTSGKWNDHHLTYYFYAVNFIYIINEFSRKYEHCFFQMPYFLFLFDIKTHVRYHVTRSWEVMRWVLYELSTYNFEKRLWLFCKSWTKKNSSCQNKSSKKSSR